MSNFKKQKVVSQTRLTFERTTSRVAFMTYVRIQCTSCRQKRWIHAFRTRALDAGEVIKHSCTACACVRTFVVIDEVM